VAVNEFRTRSAAVAELADRTAVEILIG